MSTTPAEAPASEPNGFFQFILFGLIGVSGIAVDFVVVLICREWFDLDVRIGIFPAFVVAVTWNYELNRRITFREEGAKVPWMRGYIAFVLICLAGLGMRWIATHACIEWGGLRGDRFFSLSLDYLDLQGGHVETGAIQLPFVRLSYIAYLLGIALASLFNFFGSKWFAFAPAKAQEDPPTAPQK